MKNFWLSGSEKFEEKPVNMEIGKLGSAELILPRKFRFQLISKDCEDVQIFTRKIELDFFDKIMKASFYDDQYGEIYRWIKNVGLPSEVQLKHYDGIGYTLSTFTIKGLDVQKHTCSYDYQDSNVLTHEVEFSYQEIKRKDKPRKRRTKKTQVVTDK